MVPFKKLLKLLREDFDDDHRRPTVTVSRGDYERLLEFAERKSEAAKLGKSYRRKSEASAVQMARLG